MSNSFQTHLHPIDKVNALEGQPRLLVQNPRKILEKYIHPEMTVLDLGCGTGYFTLEIAKLLDGKGKVIATDVQKGMIDILNQKLHNSDLQKQIQICHTQETSLGVTEKVDFILAFYSFHEMKFLDIILRELTKIVKPETKVLISEQWFHVSKNTFNTIIQKMETNGFEICERPRIFLSRTVLMRITKTQEIGSIIRPSLAVRQITQTPQIHSLALFV